MPSTTWEKIEPGKNCYRFYIIRLESDLFAKARVSCEWGRIGSGKHPQRQIICFDTIEEAEIYQERQVKLRTKRGYKQV